MAYSHQDFVTSLLAEFSDLRDGIDDCDGQLHMEMEAFALFTQAAKGRGDLTTYESCLKLADKLYAGADADLAAAFRMSYLEHLEFEGSRGPAAWRLLPARLQAVWNQIAAENRRLMALPQKHTGQKAHPNQKPQKEKSRKRTPRPRRRR